MSRKAAPSGPNLVKLQGDKCVFLLNVRLCALSCLHQHWLILVPTPTEPNNLTFSTLCLLPSHSGRDEKCNDTMSALPGLFVQESDLKLIILNSSYVMIEQNI